MGHAAPSLRHFYKTKSLIVTIFMFLCETLWGQSVASQIPSGLTPTRAPAYPLVTHDPYFSVWSFDDLLTSGWTRHWSGINQAMVSMVRIDGETYRLMGQSPHAAAAFPQRSVHVTPTRTIYSFGDARVELKLVFFSPVFADQLEVLARPASYIIWQVRSRDGKQHDVSLYFDSSAEFVVGDGGDQVAWSRDEIPGASLLSIGSTAQRVLHRSGDRITIDWGYLYQAAPADEETRQVISGHNSARDSFALHGDIPPHDDKRMPRAANDDVPVLASRFLLGRVGDEWQERHLILAYDDIYSAEFMHQKLRAYWRTEGVDGKELLKLALNDYEELIQKSVAYDEQLLADLTRMGGQSYAQMAALVYRQTMAAHKLVRGPAGEPYFFSKENSSNGCMATVDVAYPAAPFFLVLNPTLMKAMLDPVLAYVSMGRFKFPFAPHDIGQYPLGNGQVYGGGEISEVDQMPVEESGNMLILAAAIAHAEGNASFARAHWALFTKWANYLKEQGFDPANQLSTDDFTGHLAHNVNLSAKAIIGLGAYAQLADMVGDEQQAQNFREIARTFAAQWVAKANDGNHFRLAFDRPDTWSQKYNLIWDRILGLGLFGEQVLKKEVDFYQTKLGRYGLPLDNRASYTIQTWTVWSAMLSGSADDFSRILAPMFAFGRESPDRVPLSDWIDTATGRVTGFQARSILGGVYMPLLTDPEVTGKWRMRADQH